MDQSLVESNAAPRRVPGAAAALPPLPAVEEALVALGTFKGEFDGVFEAVGAGLPPLAQHVRELVQVLGAFRTEGAAAARKAVRARVDAIDVEVARVVQRSTDRAQATRDLATPMGVQAAGLADEFGAIRRLSDRLRVVAFNALALALRTGAEGAAFGAITRELAQVTTDASKEATAAVGLSDRVRESADRLVRQREETGEGIALLKDESRAVREALLNETEEVLEELARPQDQLAKRGGLVLEATREVMSSLQWQDILRQGIDHVLLVLRELKREHSRRFAGGVAGPEAVAGYLAREERLAELSGSLSRSTIQDTAGLVQRVQAALSHFDGAARDLGEATLHGERGPGRRIGPVLVRLRACVAAAASEGSGLDELVAGTEELVGLMNQARQPLDLLAQVPQRLRILESLLRMEVARTPQLASASAIAGDIGEVRRQLAAHVERAAAGVASLANGAQQVHASVAGGRLADRGAEAKAAEREIALVEEEMQRLQGTIDRLGTSAAELEERTGAFARGLGRFASHEEAGAVVAQACERISAQARSRLRSLAAEGVVPSAEGEDAWFAELVARFTTVEHKEVAAKLGDLQVEAGTAGGDVTLF